ncbi:hypothetical protein ABIF52_007041 [Bradyrhizobium japonicum]
MTIERPMFPSRAESVDSFSSQPAIGQRETEKRTSESRKPAEGLPSNIIDFRSASARRIPVPTDPAEPRVTAHQLAGRKRNPLRHYYSRIAGAVTIAGKLHRGEALRSEGWIDELKWLREGAKAARILADELDVIVRRTEAPEAVESLRWPTSSTRQSSRALYVKCWHVWGRSNEAPSPIAPNPQPAAAGRACPQTEAMNTRPAGSRWRAVGSIQPMADSIKRNLFRDFR